MKLENEYAKRELIILCAAAVVSATVCFILNIFAGMTSLVCGAVSVFAFILYEKKRGAKIEKLINSVDKMMLGENDFELSVYSEGELYILQCEIGKLGASLKKQTEELKNDKVLLMDSIADISHQIRTPMTAVSLNLAALQNESGSDEKKNGYCIEIKKQLSRIEWLVTALLKLAKLDAEAVKMKSETHPIAEVVGSALKPLEIIMDIKQQKAELDISGNIVCDREWTAEALGNILKNCTEHMDSGIIYVTGSENPLYSEIIIRDSGRGFDTEDIPRLFDRFFKGKNSSPDSVGIGLALSRRIISMQNGTVKAENNPKGGAQFTVRFYKSVI